MTFCYMPILKWKQGEQITLRELADADRNKMLPLIELLPFKHSPLADFKGNLKFSLAKTSALLKKAKFDTKSIAIDTTLMEPTYSSQTKLMIASCKFLHKEGIIVIPVVHPGMILAEPSELDKQGHLFRKLDHGLPQPRRMRWTSAPQDGVRRSASGALIFIIDNPNLN